VFPLKANLDNYCRKPSDGLKKLFGTFIIDGNYRTPEEMALNDYLKENSATIRPATGAYWVYQGRVENL